MHVKHSRFLYSTERLISGSFLLTSLVLGSFSAGVRTRELSCLICVRLSNVHAHFSSLRGLQAPMSTFCCQAPLAVSAALINFHYLITGSPIYLKSALPSSSPGPHRMKTVGLFGSETTPAQSIFTAALCFQLLKLIMECCCGSASLLTSDSTYWYGNSIGMQLASVVGQLTHRSHKRENGLVAWKSLWWHGFLLQMHYLNSVLVNFLLTSAPKNENRAGFRRPWACVPLVLQAHSPRAL